MTIGTALGKGISTTPHMDKSISPLEKRTGVPLDFSDFFKSLATHLKKLAEHERTYLVAKGMERGATAIGALVPVMICSALVLIALILGAFAVAEWWGTRLGDEALGLALTGGCVLVIALFFFLMRGAIRKAVRASMAKAFYADDAAYDGVSAERYVQRLRGARDEEAAQVTEHIEALQDPGLRGALLRDAAYDAVLTSGPFKYISGLFKSWNR